MLSCVFSSVPETWRNCPSTTNAVERKNYESKTGHPQPLKLAMMNLYKLDKSIASVPGLPRYALRRFLIASVNCAAVRGRETL